jgi:hypothetical protein
VAYQPTPIQEDGGQQRAWTADDETRELLKMILVELRIMNLHNAVKTDNVFDSKDVETSDAN